jgi:ACS family pantothenate transporter-like MFS transporter
MQTDLKLYGNERNWLNTWFSLGVMIGSLPAMMIQLRFVRPSILIPTCELIWSALVIGMGFAKNIETVTNQPSLETGKKNESRELLLI